MKILIVSVNHAPEVTGIGKYTGEMAAWLASRGAEVRVVTAPPHYPQWVVRDGYSARRYSRERLDGVDVVRCPLYVPRRPGGLRRLVHLASFAASSFPVLLWHAIVRRPDVVLVIEPPLACAPTALLAARLAGAHAWLHVQDFEVDVAFQLGVVRSPLFRRAALWFERALMRRFDRVSTISSAMLGRLADKGVVATRRRLFPNWVDTTRLHPDGDGAAFRSSLGLAPSTCVALYSGNLGRKQGLDVLMDAARRCIDDPDIVFVICGEGSERESLERAGRDLPNVRFLPLQPLERLNDLLSLADVHLLPQRAEAADLVMPSKLAGMMASGRPTVAGARPGSEIAIVVEGAGTVVPPGDAVAFADAVRFLCADAPLRERLGRVARERARTTWEKSAVLARAFATELGEPPVGAHDVAPVEAG